MIEKNYKLDIVFGGVFSKLVCALDTVISIDKNADNVYFNVTDSRSLNSELTNPFDYVFDQKFDDTYKQYTALHIRTPKNQICWNNTDPIDQTTNFKNYQDLVKKIKLNDKLIKVVDDLVKELNINKNTIGVHIRLCDMNVIHGKDHGVLNFDNFLSAINSEVSDNPNSDIFIASDNNESLGKLNSIFGDKIKYVKDMIRNELETSDGFALQLTHFKEESLWLEAFIEMLLLSKCGTLICRVSNLANASIIYSDTINKIIRI
jgi:hypothetical protein